MTLKTARVLELLEQKRNAFATFDTDIGLKRSLYSQALKDLCEWNSLAIAEKLAGQAAPGALPTCEWDVYRRWQVPFPHRWQSREESLAWVKHTITDIPTFAVDGSQIYVSKDLSIPIALVQVGWFENQHNCAGHYDKDIVVEVLAPSDLEASSSGEPREQKVNLRRFQMECDRLTEYMYAHADGGQRVVFADGALVATFAEAYEPQVQATYVKSCLSLLRASETARVPLVAYIDTTYTRDLTGMLRHTFDLPDAPQIHDAQLMDGFLQWGDRTPLFICARGGTQKGQQSILTSYQEMRDRVGFVYIKTNENYPARLEIPLWIHEAGLLDWVVDIVRCEAIVGGGYPYAIETADQTALLRAEDRKTFVRLLQDWSAKNELTLRMSRKTASKLRRRRMR
ncbi:MAG: DNA double-strand break repair nuclease NurA [Cyanobacteria bacterium J06642_2]